MTNQSTGLALIPSVAGPICSFPSFRVFMLSCFRDSPDAFRWFCRQRDAFDHQRLTTSVPFRISDSTRWIGESRKHERMKTRKGKEDWRTPLYAVKPVGRDESCTHIIYRRRARIARTPEESQITSAHDRIKAIRTQSELNPTTSLIAPAEHGRNSV